MAKASKGQFAKPQTANTQGEFITAREAAAALGQEARFTASAPVVNNIASDISAYSALTVLVIDAGTERSGSGGGLGLSCPSGKELLLRFIDQHGYGPPDGDGLLLRGPTGGGEINDEINPTMAVGGAFSGVIDVDGDLDDITIFLVAGQVYSISLRGTGAGALFDPFLRVFNPVANGGAQVAVDDDGGNDLNSFLTFTAGFTGQFIIRASSFNNNPDALNLDTGGYTVNAIVRGAADPIGDTNATSVPLSLGTTFGFRETGSGANNNPLNQAGNPIGYPAGTFNGDSDRYSVTLQAGHFYQFKVAGGWDGQPGAENDTAIALYDSTGTAAGLLAFNDDVSFDNGDFSSALGFYATTTGTYYFDVFAYAPGNAGYIIDFQDIDYASLDPLDAINWDSADNVPFVDVSGVPTAYVYFAVAGESFDELADNGVDPLPSFGWSDYEKQQVMLALEQFEHILGVNYVITTDSSQATFRLITTTSTQFGAYFYPQDPAFGDAQGIGAFNVDNLGWDPEDVGNVNSSGGLIQGGFAFSVILHEFGHAHGQSHPHDNGGGSDIMLGVTDVDALGIFDLNQSVYTVMSYNDGWETHPDGHGALAGNGLPLGFRADAGWQSTLSAFDIASLQLRYGVTPAYATGDNVYTLLDVNNEGTYYTTIWDTGGTDTIAYNGATRNAVIDLTAATIDYSPTGAGVISFVRTLPGETDGQAIKGGFTIAKGVVIENATGGGGNDNLIGNLAGNVLTGNGGNDNMIGRGGDDTIHGGAGDDTAYYDGVRADYVISAIITNGVVTGFEVLDNNPGAPSDSTNPIQVADEGEDTLDGVETLHFSNANFSLVGNVVVYDGDGNVVSVHTTIQAAIDAATTLAGYTIFAGSGTYAENVTVNKDLTIEGANAGTAGTDGGRIGETVINGQVVIAISGATIDGVSIVGAGAGVLGTTGVVVNAASNNFSLVNSVLSSNSAADFAIFTGAGMSGLDIGHNLIEGYSIGMYISGGTTAGSVHDNLFQGDGGPISGLGNGVNSETSHVLIQNNIFDGIYAGSLNLFPFGPNPVDLDSYVIGNTITDSGAARPVQVYPTPLSTDITGTDYNEAFNGDIAGLVSGTALRFDGQGGDDHIYGFDAGDTLLGGEGNDEIYAQAGNDNLTGGNGNDLLYGEAGTDTANFTGSLTYVDTGLGWLIQSVEGNDILNTVEVAIDGGGHRNLLVGATAYANVQAAATDAQTGDNIRLASGTWTGTVNYNVGGLTVIAQPGAVQNLTYATLGAFGITIFAANGNDTITTGTGNDVIFSGGGNDVVNGGAGNDVIYGQGGDDTVFGGTGDDFVVVDSAGDVVNELVGEGNDIVYAATTYALGLTTEIETLSTALHAGTDAINLTGSFYNQTIIGNYGNNVLNGGGGSDTLYGFFGNDTYIVHGAGSQVIEDAGAGSDTVYVSVSFALGATSEVEILSTNAHAATDAINLTGSNTAQTVVGNNGSNVLDGKGGNDLLAGLGGTDTFAFTSALGAGNVDTLFDFSVADDTIALDDAIFTAAGPLGALNANAFFTGTAAHDADDRIIYNSTTGALLYDADGNGVGAAIQFATLTPGLALTASDFMVI